MLCHMPETKSRTVSLFRNGRSQALRIPKEFEFDGEQAVITRSKDGTGIIVTPLGKQTIGEVLDDWIKEDREKGGLDFPEIGELPMKDIDPFADFEG